MSKIAEQDLKRARTLMTRNDYAAAERLLSGALQRASQDVRGIGLLGLCYYEMRRNADAQATLEQAVQIAPQQAEYHHNLGVVLAVNGEVRKAEGHMREAIRLKPDYAEAFFNMSAIIKLHGPDPVTEQIERLLAQPETSMTDRCFLHFAAGKLYDDMARYDLAFEHYAKGNAAKGVSYDRTAREEDVRAARRVFTKARLKELNARAVETGGRVMFIVGMPRSGTSLTEQILSCHSAVFGAGELPDIQAISTKLSEFAGGDAYPESVATAPAKALQGLGRHYLKRVAHLSGDAKVVVNKMPLDFRHLGLICALFRDPVILHCRRDPMDTCVSNFFQNFKPGHDFSFSLEGVGHFYRMYHSLMVHWAEVLPVPIVEVSYEALVDAPEQESRRIIEDIGLSWEPACAMPHLSARSVKTASWWQVRQPVYQTSQKRWRRYQDHLEPLRAALEGRD